MDPLSIMGIFTGLAGGIGALLGLNNANQQASQTTAQETQLLNEAQQQQEQQTEDVTLVAQRTAQEQQLQGPTDKWTADSTLSGDASKELAAQPTETKTTTPTAQLGV